MNSIKMDFTNMIIKDFIDYIITFDNMYDILDSCKTPQDKGFIFERLFDIVIKFGFCDVFTNGNYKHLIGNANNAKLKVLQIFNQFLNEMVISSNSGGCSDITLQNKNDDTYIFISSKHPKTTEDIKKSKSVDYYDIQKILAMAETTNKHIYKKYNIFLTVPNKKQVLEKVKNANKSSEYITNHMTEDHILDKDDLNKYFLAFKQDIIKNYNGDWNEIYLTSKENLVLRFHQELITQKTSNLIEEGNKSFLWGCKCRSGKTYMIGGIINKQYEKKKKLNVLIITPAPTETAPQFTDDLFNKFKDFSKFKIHHIEGSKMLSSLELETNNIFVMSKQLLQKYINSKTIMNIKNLKLDIIAFDENHFSGTTELSKDILTSYSSKNTIKIYLTATYNKPLREWNILPECQMFWDIEDEQICKSILFDEDNLERLKEKHGEEYINKTLLYYNSLGLSINDIFKPYEKMPELHLITNMFDSERYEIIKERLNKENKMGFCFDTLFGLNKTKTKFSFENEVKTVLRYISGSQKEIDGERTIFPRINNICSEIDTRNPFTQIWFLPSDNINEISLCLEKLMLEDKILKKYDVLCINRKNKELAKDIKDEINKKEIEAREKGQLGLILLAGNMLTLGITLTLCDLIILMNNTLSSDKVLQEMYRCMTEGENKKVGFVVDLNISRVLNTCVNYTVYKNEKSIDDKIKYLIHNHLINIDVDMILNKKANSDIIIKKLMDIWKEDPINSFRTLLRKLDNDYEEFDNSTQKLINKTFTKSIKDDKIGLDVIVKDSDDELQDLPSGKEKEKIKNDSESEEVEEEEKKVEEIKISFTKDVLPYVIPLTCILTIKNSNMDFVKMLNDIKENPELLDTFDDQCLIWWNKKDLIDLIKDIVNKYFDKNSNTFNISIQFKMSLQSLIDNPKELLELINDCLKPKDIEKKQFGEVFTPMTLVSEMLDKLPLEVWKNKNLKWLDPCCGMGNFPIAVYLRLMEELSDEIEDIKERKKHILENMLYMCELNKKNVLVCNQIFDINNEYKLNLYEGDSLLIDYNKLFKIKQFDIIMGNPPYQKENKKNDSARGGTNNNLYLEFINNAISLLMSNGYLLFIHPLNWRKIGSKIFTEFINRNIHYLKLNYGGEFFENVSVKTDYYVLKNSHSKNYKSIIEYINNKEIFSSNVILSNTLEFIPNMFNEHINSILDKINIYGKQYECIISSDCHKTRPHVKKGKDEKYQYQLFNTSGNPYEYFSSKPHKNQYSKKIILSNSGKLSPLYDDGKLGTTQDSMYILVNTKDEGTMIINTINSELFTFLIHICQWGNFRNEASLFTYFKYPDFNIVNNSELDDDFLNDYYKLNHEEITFLKNNSNNKKILKNNTNTSDENIVIPKISKKKTTAKKITI
jgi:adenine-specific DNA-methyltransferase